MLRHFATGVDRLLPGDDSQTRRLYKNHRWRVFLEEGKRAGP